MQQSFLLEQFLALAHSINREPSLFCNTANLGGNLTFSRGKTLSSRDSGALLNQWSRSSVTGLGFCLRRPSLSIPWWSLK